MGLQDVGVWLIGTTLTIASILKLATWNSVNGIQYIATIFDLTWLLWVNENFLIVWAIAGFLVYFLYRPKWIFTIFKKIITFGKA